MTVNEWLVSWILLCPFSGIVQICHLYLAEQPSPVDTQERAPCTVHQVSHDFSHCDPYSWPHSHSSASPFGTSGSGWRENTWMGLSRDDWHNGVGWIKTFSRTCLILVTLGLLLHKLGDQMKRVSRRRDPSQSVLFLVVISKCPLLSALRDKFWGSGGFWSDPLELFLSCRMLI